MACPKCASDRVGKPSYNDSWVIGVLCHPHLGVATKFCPDCGHKLPVKRKEKRVLRGCMNIYPDEARGEAIAVVHRTKEIADKVATPGRIARVEINQEYEEEVGVEE